MVSKCRVVPADVEVLSGLFKVLADPKRLCILDLIMRGVQCNCELGEALGLAPNLISHHLGVLRDVGLVDIERDAVDARWIYYSVNRDLLERHNDLIRAFLDPGRVQPRLTVCGPQGSAGSCASGLCAS